MHLTYPDLFPHIVAASPIELGEAGAPADEIEITPKMIKAGVEAYYDYDHRDMEPASAVERIYTVMELARKTFDKSSS